MGAFDFKAYINLSSGDTTPGRTAVRECECDGVYAIYIDAKARDTSFTHCGNGSIHSERGVTVELTPLVKINSYMANYRRGEYWLAPYYDRDITKVPDETQALVCSLEDGKFLVAVPVVNQEYKCVFCGGEGGHFSARIFSWCENLYSCSGLAFVYAIEERPAKAFEKCVKQALKLLGSGVRHRSERSYPEALEYLGWCSWDSMQIRVCETGLLEKCRELKSKDVPVRWMMIDDMWAEVRDFYGEEYADFKEMIQVMYSSALYHFDADPKRFPDGLRGCIGKLNAEGMKVGIWHPTTGYWRGIDKGGKAYEILKDYLITAENGYTVPDWTLKNSFAYYNTLHSFFRECGAELVKVDNQSMTRRYYKGLAPVGRVAREFHRGMDASVGANFNNAVINCMGMGSEDMWNRVSSPVSRVSDDFLPENSAWFTKHILQCAYSSMLQGELYFCDWDMWWTDDGQARKNSILRAISGGPIYISDMIDRTEADILTPLCLSDGRILRCDRPATATYDCATKDPTVSGEAIKLQNTVGEYGILAAFNIDSEGQPVSCSVGGEYVEGFSAEEYAVYEHFTKNVKILKRGERFTEKLMDKDDFRLYILAPIHNGVAVLGRTDKFISPATVSCIIDGKAVLKEEGPCGYVINGELTIK